MDQVSTIGLDIAKNVFQAHGIDETGEVVVRRQLRCRQVLAFFGRLPSEPLRRLKAYRQLPILRNALRELMRQRQDNSALETIRNAA